MCVCVCGIVCYIGCIFNICHLESLKYRIALFNVCASGSLICLTEYIIINVLSGVLRIVSC